MHLVEDHQAVVAGEPGVYRAHPVADAVAPKQQARAELIDGGDHHPGLVGPSGPLAVDRYAASQGCHPQRLLERLLGVGQRAERTPHIGQDSGGGRTDPVADELGSLVDLVHHDAPVDDEHDPAGRDVGPQCQREHGSVQHGGLARARRQIDHIGPSSLLDHLPSQTALPPIRLMAVDSLEVAVEVRCGQFTHRPQPRQRPSLQRSPRPPVASAPSPRSARCPASALREPALRTRPTHGPTAGPRPQRLRGLA